ncbi:hypothetical protein [Flavisolibacter tropicus]|uniref:Uncharacterized protein n=1 Tax=Flavisolibacter tropicus TaxID=1492898 RepID=A0A172TW20_9BACT|nr:hypothetical protein [Flavisolibacter tropicus]ANE51275.1 hypothetical protein SY85_12905 [Flavisolibacter tropicus]
MRTAFLLLLAFAVSIVKAQEIKSPEDSSGHNVKVYKVNPGERVSDALLSNGGLYQYHKFMQGEVFYKGGNYGSGVLNYNRLTGEMQFIDPKGDTLTLDNEKEIEKVVIGPDTFYYSQGYLQKVVEFSSTVAKQTYLELSNREKVGAFGTVAQNAIDTHTTIVTNQGFKSVVAQEILTYREKTIYFIGDRYGHFKLLNKKNVLYLYSKKEKEVSAYLKDNPVNFQKEADVQRLIEFLKDLKA